MKKLIGFSAVVVFVLGMSQNALAIKPLADNFKAVYAGDGANPEFVALVGEAKCNVCHVEKQDKKKVRNKYGEALHELLEKDGFPMADFKKEPAKFTDRVKEILKKAEGEASGDEKLKTFGDRIKANLLPGGDKDGK